MARLGSKEQKDKTWGEVATLRRAELRKDMMKQMLHASGALMGIARKQDLTQNMTTAVKAGGGYDVDGIVNHLETYSNDTGKFSILDDLETVFATTQAKVADKTWVFTWHLVRRPASAKVRKFSPAMIGDIRNTINAGELMELLADSTFVHARHYRKSNGSAQRDDNSTVYETMDDAEAAQGDGEGIWLNVPKAFRIGDSFSVEGSFFKGKNTGRDGLDEDVFYHPASDLTLLYWRALKPYKNSALVRGEAFPPPAPPSKKQPVFHGH